MGPQEAVELGRQAIVIALLIGAPVLIVGMAVGLAIGLLQALTQIQDQTISFVPKILAMIVALAICLPWLVQMMAEYSEDVYLNIPRLISGG